MSDIYMGLMKIARETGEDEFDIIHALKVQYNINITSAEIEKRINNLVGIIIFEPFSKIQYQNLKDEFIDGFNLNHYKKFVNIIKKNKKTYLSFPIFVPLSTIQDVIFEDLREEHNIILNSISESDWLQIKNKDIWKKAEMQVAREIIAEKLNNNSEITSSFLCS